jgi:hypothetical protein
MALLQNRGAVATGSNVAKAHDGRNATRYVLGDPFNDAGHKVCG